MEQIELLQIQMNRERQNGALYDALAGAFEAMNLPGLAAFMARNGDEERGHAKKFFDYISDIGAQPRIDPLELESVVLSVDIYADALDLFKIAYNGEASNRDALYALDAECDPGVCAFLVEIILEQIKSVKEFAEHCTAMELAQNDGAALLWLDAKLGKVG